MSEVIINLNIFIKDKEPTEAYKDLYKQLSLLPDNMSWESCEFFVDREIFSFHKFMEKFWSDKEETELNNYRKED